MHHKPEIPTRIYTILLIIDIVPKIVSTRLKLNNPISNQFIAPIITKANAILSIIFMKTIPFLAFLVIVYSKNKIVFKKIKNKYKTCF